MTNTKNDSPTIAISPEEVLIMQAAMNKMDLMLSNNKTVDLANRLNIMYSLMVSSMNTLTKISHFLNIDAIDNVKMLSYNMQNALHVFLTNPNFLDKENTSEEEKPNSDNIHEISDILPDNETTQTENVSNVISFDRFKNKK